MAVYVISVAAELAGVHPQTLRIYERKGLLGPGPDPGREQALQRQRHRAVAAYPGTDREGLNLEGVKRVIELETEVARLHEEVARRGPRPVKRWSRCTATTGGTWYRSTRTPCAGYPRTGKRGPSNWGGRSRLQGRRTTCDNRSETDLQHNLLPRQAAAVPGGAMTRRNTNWRSMQIAGHRKLKKLSAPR